MYDLTIIGNGIIGLLTAHNYIQIEPKAKIAVIGPFQKYNSATMASGAMINVMPEIDTISFGNDYFQKKIQIGLNSTNLWNNMFKKKIFNNKIKTADDTILYRQKKGPYYEKKAFEISKLNCKKNKKFSNKKINFFKNDQDYFTIKDEIAVDSNQLMHNLEKRLRKKVHFIDDYVKGLDTSNSNKNQKVITINGKVILSKKNLICCGYNSGKLMKSINKKSIQILSSIGDGFLVSNAKPFLSKIPSRSVIRTSNRGSSCGIHAVPLSDDKFYLGSTSNLSFNPLIEQQKYGSIEYILSCFKNEIFSKVNSFHIKNVRGFRPLSIDGMPAVGPLNNNTFVITGTFRDGLTNAPFYSNVFLEWIYKNNNKYSSIIEDWSPLREPISYGQQSNSIEEYIDTKLCGLLEHKSIGNKKISLVRNELYMEAKVIYKNLKTQKKIKSDFSVHPLILNLFK